MLSTVSIVCDSLFRDPTILWFYEKYFFLPGSLPRSCVFITLQAPGWESVMNFILKFTIHFEALRRRWGWWRGAFPDDSDGKESACNARDLGSIPGSGRSPGEENGYPLQYFWPENPMDREAWWATVQEVVKESDTT